MNGTTIPPWSTPGPQAFGAVPWLAAPSTPELDRWLDGCEADLVHPGRVEGVLRRQGWSPADGAAIASAYRRRFNEHPLGYTVLLVTTGVAALAAGTSGHYLVDGLDRPVNRNALALWLTVLLCSLPFAAWAHRWAAQVDRHDPVAAWSRPRQVLARTLLWASGVVGAIRLLTYGAQLVGALVGATWARHRSLAAGALNVGFSLAISVPLGMWSFRFLHRFDTEDPTVPPAERHRAAE